MHIVLIGLPASGKGTQAALLEQRYGGAHIVSTGDLLRSRAREADSIARSIRTKMQEGSLVPLNIVNSVISEFLHKRGYTSNDIYIWDGYPRDCDQARNFLQVLDSYGVHRSEVRAIEISVPPEVAYERIMMRCICTSCKAIFRKEELNGNEVCNECGGRVSRRVDDNGQTAKARINFSHFECGKVVDFLQLNGIQYTEIDGMLLKQEVFEIIQSNISK